jgi:hypothetical protein
MVIGVMSKSDGPLSPGPGGTTGGFLPLVYSGGRSAVSVNGTNP